MFKTSHRPTKMRLSLAVALLFGCAAAYGADFQRGQELFDEGKFPEAIDLLVEEVEENPANEAARILLAEAYEKAERLEEATATWDDLFALSRSEENLRLARIGLCRLRRIQIDRENVDLANLETPEDILKIPMPEIDWTGLEVVEDPKLKPPPTWTYKVPKVPPIEYETEHFIVYSHNEKLSKIVGERAEAYMEWVMKHLFGGRSWASRYPIIVNKDIAAHTANGGGGGGTAFPNITGAPEKIMIFQLSPHKDEQGEIYKYSILDILTHEMTHALLFEFFGAQKIPYWIHEACAGRFEQSTDQYLRSARFARGVVAGEYFRFADLFKQKGYPAGMKNVYFYEQGAVIVTYLFEAGPEAMQVYLSEILAGRTQAEAVAAVLGIPVEGAIEEFERRWVEWMRVRYIQDLGRAEDVADLVTAEKSDHEIFRPWVNELDTASNIETWREVDLNSLDKFVAVGDTKEDWSTSGGVLRCDASGEKEVSILGVRMNEIAPVAVICDVKYLGTPGDEHAWFGFTQLDTDLYDTRVEVLARLTDNAHHKVACFWTDELSIYIDGVCAGRYPARLIGGDAPDVDYPLAFVAYGPVEIQDVNVGAIKKFSDKPVVEEEEAESSKKERKSRRARERKDRQKGPGG